MIYSLVSIIFATEIQYNEKMKRRFAPLFLACLLMPTILFAQNISDYYVYFSDGNVEAYPKEFVKALDQTSENITITLINDSVLTWLATDILQICDESPIYPQFTDFKFDDKLNHQLSYDVDAIVDSLSVTATVGAIGKWLTPSFKTDSKVTLVYVGDEQQYSGQSRLRFANDVVYTLSLPGHRRLSMEKISDEVWSDIETNTTEITLTADMLSTNAPSGRGEGLDKLIDNNPSTYFHSTWSNDPVYEKLPENEFPYISVELPSPINALQFYYQARIDASNRNPYAFKVYVSDDNANWEQVAYFDEHSGIPTAGEGAEFTSPTIDLDQAYKYWRFEQTACAYKNYMVLSTFRLFEVLSTDSESELLKPATYAYRMMPLGREVTVKVDWLTDNAAVPRIDIDIENGEMVSSKNYYLNAYITIQGQGVWPDFQDSVQIKGRGNSSWSDNPYAKNPYRLKFASTVKPFGLKKGKNWNLIAQSQHNSMMTNAMAMKTAQLVGAAAANDVIPVDLYMNGMYRGSYIFTQKTGLANNSVDLDDESAAVFLELDTYYDEIYRFNSSKYRLPVNIKEPDFSEGKTVLDLEQTKNDFNRFETAIYESSNFERLVDVDMLARFMLVNELVLNTEIGHPKSVFLYKEDLNIMGSTYVFGPVWDFDWSYGYESNRSYCNIPATQDIFSYHPSGKGTKFFSKIWSSSELVKRQYYALWTDFIQNHLQELLDYADDYLAYANSSFLENAYMWNDGNNYAAIAENMKVWLADRAEHILRNLTPYDLEVAMQHLFGDVNTDGHIDVIDRDLTIDYLLGSSPLAFNFDQADIDANAEITINDVAWLNSLIDQQEKSAARQLTRFDEWAPDIEDEDEDVDEAPYTATRNADPMHPITTSDTRGATSWSHTLTIEDGLPGNYENSCYSYTSPFLTPTSPINKLRLTVSETNTGDAGSGYVCFAIAEFYLYDENGYPVELTADNFTTNAQEPTEGPLEHIVDGYKNTYFHSTWTESADSDHYIEITLPEPLSSFSFSYLTRNHKISPTVITVSQGAIQQDDDIFMSEGLGVQVKETAEGMEWALSLSLENETPYVAFQVDLQLPEGITVFDDMTDLTPTSRLESTHIMANSYHPDGTYRILAYSENNSPIEDTSGTLFKLLLTADRELTAGTAPLTVSNVRMITPAGFETRMADIEVPVKISETGIESTSADYTVTYYTLEGHQLPAPREGIIICRKVYSDGRVETVKRTYPAAQ